MSKGKNMFITAGLPSALVIVLVVVLAALGVLSYVSGRNDLALTERTADMTQAYYRAVAESESKLAELNEAPGEQNVYAEFDAGDGRVLSVCYALQNGFYQVKTRTLSTTPSSVSFDDEFLPIFQGEVEEWN